MKHKNLFLSLTFKIIICINKFLSYFSLAFFSSSPHLTTTITIFFSAIEEGMLNLKLHCKRKYGHAQASKVCSCSSFEGAKEEE
ncbi:hypothetical protein LINPERHAP2_LOCUS28998 [Linum perenne]